jgi:integrase
MPLTLVAPRKGLSPNYRIRGTVKAGVKSRYIDETTGVANRQLAEQIRIKREAEILQELIHGVRASHSFAEAAVEYIEDVKPTGPQRDAIIGRSRKDGTVGPNLVDDLGEKPVDQIGQEDVDTIKKKRFRNCKPGTIQRFLLTPLTAVLNHAAKRGWCVRPSFDRPKYKDQRTRWANYEEADRPLAAAVSKAKCCAKNIRTWQATYLRTLILFLLLTGCRIGEALFLEWEDVDLNARWLVFRNTKRSKRGEDRPGEDRGVPIHRQLVIALANLPVPADGKRTGRVFKTANGNPYSDRDADIDGRGGRINKAWNRVCQGAEIADLHIHDLRHTCATWLLMAGVGDEVRDDILGHSSTETGRRYAHVPRPLPLAAIEKLPERQMQFPAVQVRRARVKSV